MIYPQLFANDSTKTLPMDKFIEGFRAGLKGKMDKMNPEQAQMVFQTAGTKIQQRYFEKAYGQQKKKNDAYMAKISKQPGVKSLGGGVYYKEIKAGNGKTPTSQDMTKVNYEGKDYRRKGLRQAEQRQHACKRHDTGLDSRSYPYEGWFHMGGLHSLQRRLRFSGQGSD